MSETSLTAVDLAREPAFELAGGEVRPAELEVAVGGRRERLTPKTMQLLVAMARRRGEALSRNGLIRTYWEDGVVAQDSLDDCIGRLREVGESTGGFEVAGVPTVGYRLLLRPSSRPPQRRARTAQEVFLAVLPFENLSGDEDLTYFSDGVSEEILRTVAMTTGLKVVGRSSSFSFRGRDKYVPRIAEQLGATHVLDGSVRRIEERVQITAHLTDAATQKVLWSDRFEGPLAEIFGLEDEIAAAVAAALETKLSRSSRLKAINPAAYDAYLRAKGSTEQWLGGNDAVQLEQALDLAPDFAPALASLALTLALKSHADVLEEPYETLSARARQAAERALELDPHAGAAYAALSVLQPVCGAFAERAALIDRALEVAPDDPWVLFHACRSAQAVGRHLEAFQYTSRAREIEPLWPQGANQYASVLDDLGLRETANAEFDAARARWPRIGYIAVNALIRASFAEDWARVDRLVADIQANGPKGEAIDEALRQAADLRAFDASIAPAAAQRIRRWLAATGRLNVGIHMLCGVGFADEAFAIVEEASFDHLFEPGGRIAARVAGEGPPSTQVAFVGLPSLFIRSGEAMRRDPRFVALCGKLGLVDYWVRSERWPDCAQEVPYDFRAECFRRWR
jgi:TolB-like protein